MTEGHPYRCCLGRKYAVTFSRSLFTLCSIIREINMENPILHLLRNTVDAVPEALTRIISNISALQIFISKADQI
jgi:hypothetical protein